jgi:hypothetical protein
MRIILGLLLLVSLASAQLPSDLITHQNAPVAIDLQHVSPNAARSIDNLNPELTAFQTRDMADLGHYSASTGEETQGSNETQTEAIKDFVGESVAPLVNVGNATDNITEINGTMVWL